MSNTLLHPGVKSDTLVNGGALKLALNVLRRAGKTEVADELEKTAVRPSNGFQATIGPSRGAHLNVASQCRATASSQLATEVLVDGGSGTLRELLNDAANVIETTHQL